MTALSGMVAIGDEEYRRNFRRVQMYTNLKNVLNSYEYLLKAIAPQAGITLGKETLVPLVGRFMSKESWYQLFDSRRKQGLVNGSSTQEFLTKLNQLRADKQLNASPSGYWAQKFLVMCLARNMTTHTYPSDDGYYGDWFGPMLDAAVITTFYTWQLAKAKKWT